MPQHAEDVAQVELGIDLVQARGGDRYLELAPRYWSATRARLDPNELEQEIGPLKVPEPPLPTATAAPLPAELGPAT